MWFQRFMGERTSTSLMDRTIVQFSSFWIWCKVLLMLTIVYERFWFFWTWPWILYVGQLWCNTFRLRFNDNHGLWHGRLSYFELIFMLLWKFLVVSLGCLQSISPIEFDACAFTPWLISAWNLPNFQARWSIWWALDLGLMGMRKWEEALTFSIITLFINCSEYCFHLLL